jgi:hypothetical protein
MTADELQTLRDAARAARRDADEYRRAHEHNPGAPPVADERASELERLAAEASTKLAVAESQGRTEARAQRRADQVAEDAGLQARLRAEAQARRDASAAEAAPSKRRAAR